MKIIKLIAIFLGILAVIIGVMFWSPDPGPNPNPLPLIGNNEYAARLSNRISTDWKECKKWNVQLYDSFTEEIDQCKKSDLITPPYATSLLDQNSLDAAERLCALIFAEFNKSNCSYNVVKEYINTNIIELTKRDNAIASFTDIENAKKCWGVYYKISSFGWYDFSENSDFNSTQLTWSRFKGLYDGKDPHTVAKELINDDLYIKYLSNIDALKNTLNSDKITAKLYGNRFTYYEQLTTEINRYSKRAPLNDVMLTSLTKAYSNLYAEYLENDAQYKQLHSTASAAKRSYDLELKEKKELLVKIQGMEKKLASKIKSVDELSSNIVTLNQSLANLKKQYLNQKNKKTKNKTSKSITSVEKSITSYTNTKNKFTNEYNQMYSETESLRRKYNSLR